MKQIIQKQSDGRIDLTEVPTPVLRADGVLVKTAYSLISAGTERAKVELAKKNLLGKALARPDQVRQVIETFRQVGFAATMQKVTSKLESLSPLGYSASGVVLAVGAQVKGFIPGDKVACAGGGYANHAEINYIPQNLCVKLPERLGLDEAACGTVGAIALQGVRQAEVALAETVGVIGLGLLGLLTVQLLRATGCRVVGIDINLERCKLAQELGADSAATLNDSSLLDVICRRYSPSGLDAVILTAATTSNEPIRLAGRLCRDRGRIVIVGAVGMDIPRTPFYEKELDVRLSRSYGPGRYDSNYEEKGHDYPIGYVRWTEGRNIAAFLDLVAQRKVDVKTLITHRFAFNDAVQAYTLIEGKTKEPYLGVLLDYGLSGNEEVKAPAATSVRVAPAKYTDTKVGLAMLGAGNFAQSMLLPHLRHQRHIRLYTIITPSGITARSVAERFGFEECASDAQVAISSNDVQLILIASRHDSHADLIVRSLLANKSVFVEKPLALTSSQLLLIKETYYQMQSRIGSAFLMVGFNRRFAPLVVELREFMAGVTEPLMMHYRVNAGYIPPMHWIQDRQVGGGRVVGELCHFVDLLLNINSSPPVEVYARALPDQGRYCQDNIAVTIHFANGSVGTITYISNGDNSVEKERLEVFGGGRVAILDDFRQLTLAASGKKRVRKASLDKGHQQEMAMLVDAVRQGKPSPIPFEELALVTSTTFSIAESMTLGRPVTIDLLSNESDT